MIEDIFPHYSKEPKFYVYKHIDFDGITMYVGKGTSKRAYQVSRRDSSHKQWIESCSHNYVELVEEGLTELEAFRLENKLLRQEEPIYNKIRNY